MTALQRQTLHDTASVRAPERAPAHARVAPLCQFMAKVHHWFTAKVHHATARR